MTIYQSTWIFLLLSILFHTFVCGNGLEDCNCECTFMMKSRHVCDWISEIKPNGDENTSLLKRYVNDFNKFRNWYQNKEAEIEQAVNALITPYIERKVQQVADDKLLLPNSITSTKKTENVDPISVTETAEKPRESDKKSPEAKDEFMTLFSNMRDELLIKIQVVEENSLKDKEEILDELKELEDVLKSELVSERRLRENLEKKLNSFIDSQMAVVGTIRNNIASSAENLKGYVTQNQRHIQDYNTVLLNMRNLEQKTDEIEAEAKSCANCQSVRNLEQKMEEIKLKSDVNSLSVEKLEEEIKEEMKNDVNSSSFRNLEQKVKELETESKSCANCQSVRNLELKVKELEAESKSCANCQSVRNLEQKMEEVKLKNDVNLLSVEKLEEKIKEEMKNDVNSSSFRNLEQKVKELEAEAKSCANCQSVRNLEQKMEELKLKSDVNSLSFEKLVEKMKEEMKNDVNFSSFRNLEQKVIELESEMKNFTNSVINVDQKIQEEITKRDRNSSKTVEEIEKIDKKIQENSRTIRNLKDKINELEADVMRCANSQFVTKLGKDLRDLDNVTKSLLDKFDLVISPLVQQLDEKKGADANISETLGNHSSQISDLWGHIEAVENFQKLMHNDSTLMQRNRIGTRMTNTSLENENDIVKNTTPAAENDVISSTPDTIIYSTSLEKCGEAKIPGRQGSTDGNVVLSHSQSAEIKEISRRFFVLLQYKGRSKRRYTNNCGAVVINEKWAITSGHCAENPVASYRLLIDTTQNQRLFMYKVHPFIHGEFKVSSAHSADVALLNLEKSLNSYGLIGLIASACLPDKTASNNVTGPAAFIGWSDLENEAQIASFLELYDVSIITDDNCRRSYPGIIRGSMICTEYDERVLLSCEQYGGMLVKLIEGRVTLIGISTNCGNRDKPVVYTEVAHFVDWIHSTIRRVVEEMR